MVDFKGQDLKGRNLSNFNLKGANLEGVDLSCANLEGANLEGANLSGAKIFKANLSRVNACKSVFKYAHLGSCIMTGLDADDADFSHAILSHSLINGSSFRRSNFEKADFYGSSLTDCYFSLANLTGARMAGANLANSNFIEAILDGTDFECSNLSFAIFDHKPSNEYKFGKVLDRPIIGYKKASKDVITKVNGAVYNLRVPVIVTLEIPEGAVVLSVNGCKCRTNLARVLDTEYLVETDEYLRNFIPENEEEFAMLAEVRDRPVRSIYDHEFFYIPGIEIKIKDFDLSYNIECSTGIHFFLTKKEAIDFKY